LANVKKQILLSITMLGTALAVASILYANRPASEVAAPPPRTITVDVAEVIQETVRVPVQAQGTVSPLKETTLFAEVGGRVVDVSDSFNVGGFVARDEVLLRIDPRDFQTTLLRARAAVESAESNLAQEKGRAEVALREWKRLPANSQRSDDARDLYLRKPQLEQAEAQLLAALADLDTAKDNLDRTVVRAPYDALIRAKHSELGQFAGPSAKLAEIFSVEQAEVRLPIPQSKLSYLELPGPEGYQEVVTIDLYSDVSGELTHWPATLHRTEGVYDERSRVLYTVARVEDPYGLKSGNITPLRIGSFVTANIPGKAIPGLVRLPRHTLRAGNRVWIIDDQQRLRSREVSLLKVGGDNIYVSKGLAQGDLVSLTSLDEASAGSLTKIMSRVRSDQLNSVSPQRESESPTEEPDQEENPIRIASDPNLAEL
jgi:RND family efflux transporter MFP subunit